MSICCIKMYFLHATIIGLQALVSNGTKTIKYFKHGFIVYSCQWDQRPVATSVAKHSTKTSMTVSFSHLNLLQKLTSISVPHNFWWKFEDSKSITRASKIHSNWKRYSKIFSIWNSSAILSWSQILNDILTMFRSAQDKSRFACC